MPRRKGTLNMARYVLLEFQDDNTAEKFMDKIALAKGKFRVVGLFVKPRRWCVCTPASGYHKNQIVRGVKYGWWVCIVCKRPRKGGHQLTNILPPFKGPVDEDEYTTTCTSIDVTPVLTSRLGRNIVE